MTAEEIAGRWVPNEDMHPMVNVWNREWMTKDGEMHGTYHGQYSIPDEALRRGIMWRFPAESKAASFD